MYMETLGVSISPEMLALLEVIARKRRVSVEEIIVQAVAEYVAEDSQSV